MEIIVHSDATMQQLGRLLARVLEKGDVVYLLGELGAGKTTLVRGVAAGAGYEGRVTSPTFTLMNIYQAATDIYHFDFYRLEGNELDDLGLEDYLEKEGISIIEWAEKGEKFLPEEALIIKIQLVDDNYERERKVSISGNGNKYRQKIEELKKSVSAGS
ncbi:MAG: tRNA (adenosine(37)-N6)-threonylcarbamoyltransferase complex ATPase subunit type 1 TsaE [Syntrophomonadaceae bacterium]|nr:tRNA (adenosine(37)-N6)-threonylcarbamoyltransferase complex ATPase subunit type 1 TsaE [Syntrophomonadaceae bacterium]